MPPASTDPHDAAAAFKGLLFALLVAAVFWGTALAVAAVFVMTALG